MAVMVHEQQQDRMKLSSFSPVIAAHFDKAASSYVNAATLQQQVALDLTALLPAAAPIPSLVQQNQVLLDVGCGPGWYHPQLVNHCSELWAVDLSAAMLAQAQTLGCASRYIQADVCQIPLPDGSVDVIFSSLMLQWCATPQQAFSELCRLLKPGGTLLLSTLVQGSLREFQQSWAGVDDDAHQLELLAATELLAQLLPLGVNIVSEQKQYQVFYPDVRALARGFKQIGANFVQGRQGQGLMGKQRWLAFANNYEQFRGARGLPLSYQVLQLVVTKPAAAATVPGSARFKQGATD
ncbi:malonyl-[acyl-carrier protein] O-methyltransferase BioC [Rheinheimera riviphila]|uniref:Malonyl-[acyl-carrier protein] O-methyltransferase n=1 Tax=Rheinheimera riviphila TaxID=1834037 RepID=A0A437R212_9GAMM|nr:malonyl-ACP O-methyltransferase BioC [Rheinheimera riviphila]RVU40785.1 malonyl-[acyl-carrier protein] O-methyltransferase BioC [Rheinheimera riviphila]